MTTKLASTLPNKHGLHVIADDLVRDPHGKHIVIAVIDCAKVVLDTDTDDAIPVARIRRIEVIRDEEAMSTAAALLQAASNGRQGLQPLPFDEDALQSALAEAGLEDVTVTVRGGAA